MASRKVLSKKQVANSDSYRPAPAAVETARLNEGAELLKDSATDEIWRGTVRIDAYVDVPVYFRMGSLRSIVSELVCSVLGRTLGLPIPRPYLIEVTRSALPGSKNWKAREERRVTFACAEVSESTAFSQIIAQDSEYARQLLRKWDLYPHTVIFDEWVANLDRNHSNILFSANVIWLIDHADALGGILSELHALTEIQTDSFTNVLLDRHVADFTHQDKADLITIAGEIMNYASDIDLDAAIACAAVESITSLEAASEVLEFLATRLKNTVPFLCNRVGLHQFDFENAK
ncbi:hypothetical protein J2794_003564 [Paraburkholderia terricola]|uniref:HipA family kinase n=1 Tax=Paraburkholderia terricola TaxID=169427 RepID=UPI002858C19C|nr:HipA family kinase [Paraburkholderia terricola]MDR6447448.1 hypothetical protein [Paraburkholderia terricola]